jgi:hypothetical protein
MGGGALMTPALILTGLARPVIAVGTDLVWGTLTKAVGAVAHYREKNIDPVIVKRLAVGSVPGALLGLALLYYLHSRGTVAVDKLVVRMLAVALMCVALSLFVRAARGPRVQTAHEPFLTRGPAWMTSVLGGVVGFLVSLTSVGSGSLIVACLLVLYPMIPMKRIVGSDIAHALILVGVSALGHLGLGSINFPLLGALLIGSLPGVWIGSRMTAIFPERILQPILATTLFFLGYKLL